jgi:hypothetical protein
MDSPNKFRKCEAALERNNSISECAKLSGSVLVSHHGIPIKFETKIGFKRRREPRLFDEESGPSFAVGWPWWEEC